MTARAIGPRDVEEGQGRDMTGHGSWGGRFPANDIINLLDNFPTHNLAESTSQDLALGELLDLVGIENVRELRLGYASAAGNPALRDRISLLSAVPADNVLTTQGVALALFLLAFEHCRPGDEVVIATPCFPPTRDAMTGTGVRVIPFALDFDDGYRLDVDRLAERLSPRTTLVCLASPQNPSGVRVRATEVEALLDAMSRNAPRALLLIDEIYRDATHGSAPVPPSFAPRDPRIITTGSISKAHGAPGLRVGWLTVSDPDLRARLTVAKMNIVLSSSVLDEALAERILAHRDEVLAPRRTNLERALTILGDWHARQEHRLDWVLPEGGAMCCMRLRSDHFDDSSVARFWEQLPDNDIQLGAGPWFGESTRVFRLGFGYLALPDFRTALDRLAATMDTLID
jgi:aspartate/methionine/tyrosine aminotransferase